MLQVAGASHEVGAFDDVAIGLSLARQPSEGVHVTLDLESGNPVAHSKYVHARGSVPTDVDLMSDEMLPVGQGGGKLAAERGPHLDVSHGRNATATSGAGSPGA